MSSLKRRALLFAPLAAAAQDSSEPRKGTNEPAGIPYDGYFVSDRFGRQIHFFITNEQDKKLPLVVSILGSGSDSNFLKRGDRVLDAHRALREVFKDRARVLIVEKPGVQFGEHPARPGTSEGSSEEFRREYTLDRWSEAMSAALRAARTLSF